MTIEQAKRELWDGFKENDLVTGVGIRGNAPNETIVVFLTKPSDFEGPSEYEGYRVNYEVSGTIRAL